MAARIRFVICVGLCLMLSSCGRDDKVIFISSDANQVSQGPFNFSFNVVKGEPVQFTVDGSGIILDSSSVSWSSNDPAVATVDQNGMVTGIAVGLATITATSGSFSVSTTVGVVSPDPGAADLTLSGAALYEDRLFDENGFTGSIIPKPIRGVTIKVIAIDGFITLASGSTLSDGSFSFAGINNASRRGGVYIQVITETASANPTRVKIRNSLTGQALLALISSAIDDSITNSFPGVQVTAQSSDVGGAFNILDVLSKGSEFIQTANASLCPSPSIPCSPPLVTAYWEPGTSTGTFFDDQLDAIFILGDTTGDSDEYDDSVIAHEYGHFVLKHFSHDNSLGGPHAINENDQDIRLSWSEGWANFFSSAARSNSIYVDTTTSGTALSFNLEDYTSVKFSPPSSLGNVAIYTTSEIAVAGVLWDIQDNPPAGDDDPLTTLSFNQLWQTTMNIPALQPATMETFWLEFEALHPTSATVLQTIMKGRKIELLPDTGEAVEQNLIVDAPQHHTLYRPGADPTGDIDTIQFNVVAGNIYTLKTFNLTNGADTLLTIEGGPTILQHDNLGCLSTPPCPPNNKTTLSSSITWTPATDMLLTAEVRRSPIAPPSAGQFGSYDIKLTTP